MSWLLRGLLGVAVLAGLGVGWLALQWGDRPDLAPYHEAWQLPAAGPAQAGERRVTVSFLGVATLLISDGRTHLMTDGWFTRVSLADLALRRPVSPDADAIGRGLRAAGVSRLAAVMPVHSHYDHAQDAPEVARRTGALLLGSATTAWIGRGGGLPEEQIRVVEPGVPLRFGDFSVTFVTSKHVDLPLGQGRIGEELDAPLVPPVPATDYPEGASWSIFVSHPLGTLLVQGSAGYVEGGLDGYRADAVLLGVGALERMGPEYTERYLDEIVGRVGATRVIPIHFDDLTAPSDGPLVAMPAFLDDVRVTFDALVARAEADPELEFALLPWQQPAVLFPD